MKENDDAVAQARAKAEESIWGRLVWAFQDQEDERVAKIKERIEAEAAYPVSGTAPSGWTVTVNEGLKDGTVQVSKDVWDILEIHSKNDSVGMLKALMDMRARNAYRQQIRGY